MEMGADCIDVMYTCRGGSEKGWTKIEMPPRTACPRPATKHRRRQDRHSSTVDKKAFGQCGVL